MALFACASCLLGWSTMSQVARSALEARGCNPCLSSKLRMLIVVVCACGAISAWMLIDDVIACLSFSFACACISSILVCDLLEHVIPTELVVAFAVLSCTFRVSLEGLSELAVIALPAGCVAASLLALNHVRIKSGKTEFIGSGDARMIVPLVIFSGCNGVVFGVFAASLTVLAYASMKLVTGRATLQTSIALGPGLAAWLFAGTLIPFLWH